MDTDKIKVVINNRQRVVGMPSGLRLAIRKGCIAVLKSEDFTGCAQVSVSLVNNEEIQKLNKIHRNIDEVTDVLSFPLGENGVYDIDPGTNAKMLGDIVISAEKAKEQAESHLHQFSEEVVYLAVHAMFHLLGYDHADGKSKAQMREKEGHVLGLLGFNPAVSFIM